MSREFINYEKNVAEQTPLPRRRAVVAAAALSVAVLVSGCGTSHSESKPNRVPCANSDFRPLPAASTVDQYIDNRVGDILPCDYLGDMAIPFNTESPLLKLKEDEFNASEFESSGNFGGWLFFGIGTFSGNNAAYGQTIKKDVYAMQILGTDGTYKKLIVDAEKVSLKPCDSNNCQPTINIEIVKTVLFKKGKDDKSSIWESDSPLHDGWNRYNSAAGVSLLLPREKVVGKIYEDGSVTGGPAAPGTVVSSLASKIVVSLPENLLGEPSVK